MAYIVTTDINLIHAISNWKQEFDAKFLVCYVDVRNHLTTWVSNLPTQEEEGEICYSSKKHNSSSGGKKRLSQAATDLVDETALLVPHKKPPCS